MNSDFLYLDGLDDHWSLPNDKIIQLGIYDSFISNKVQTSLNRLINLNHTQFIKPIGSEIGTENMYELSSTILIHSDSTISPEINISSRTQKLSTNLGYQRHGSDSTYISQKCISLGQFRSESDIIEPLLRDIKVASINLDVLRHSEAPAIKDNFPSGMTTEELCQIARYLGESNNIKTLEIIVDTKDHEVKIESMIVAQLIWYFSEGMTLDKHIHPSTSTEFQEYIVDTDSLNHTYHFFRSIKNGKWWLKTLSSEYVACSEQEYLDTKNHGLPERLLFAF